MPIGEAHRAEAAERSPTRLQSEGVRADVDERDDTLGKRIRDAELEKVPYVVVWGDRESWDSLAVRRRGGEQLVITGDALLDELRAVAKL